MSLDFTSRELATVLAALRHWQQDLIDNEEEPICEHFSERVTPLSPGEIDDLCQRLNLRPSRRQHPARGRTGDKSP